MRGIRAGWRQECFLIGSRMTDGIIVGNEIRMTARIDDRNICHKIIIKMLSILTQIDATITVSHVND
jgi:hypothetical protein